MAAFACGVGNINRLLAMRWVARVEMDAPSPFMRGRHFPVRLSPADFENGPKLTHCLAKLDL